MEAIKDMELKYSLNKTVKSPFGDFPRRGLSPNSFKQMYDIIHSTKMKKHARVVCFY